MRNPIINVAKSTDTSTQQTTAARVGGAAMPIAGILAWLVPGLGHWFLGERVRGVVFFVFTTVTFWTGVAIGGMKSTVNYAENGPWFAAQLCMGGEAVIAWAGSRYVQGAYPKSEQSRISAYWPSDNIAVIYTGITGLLNLLIIIDALARADARLPITETGPPAPKRGSR